MDDGTSLWITAVTGLERRRRRRRRRRRTAVKGLERIR
jgi:hypothetical protein